MIVEASKRDILDFLVWLRNRFGFSTLTAIEGFILKDLTITDAGLVFKQRIPLGAADVLASVSPTLDGKLIIRLVQIKLLGMGFLVKPLRAMAANAILTQLRPYSEWFSCAVTDQNEIVLSREDVEVFKAYTRADLVVIDVELV